MPTTRSPLTEMTVNIVEEQLHDLDPQRRSARKRTEEAIRRGRPKDYRLPNRIDGQFAPRTIAMLRAPAYRVLSLSEAARLDRLDSPEKIRRQPQQLWVAISILNRSPLAG